MSMYDVEVFNRNAFLHLFRRHDAEFDAAKEVRAQALKMAADKTAQFARRFFISERDRNISERQAPIFSEKDPGTKPRDVSEREKRAQRQRCQKHRACAIEEIN